MVCELLFSATSETSQLSTHEEGRPNLALVHKWGSGRKDKSGLKKTTKQQTSVKYMSKDFSKALIYWTKLIFAYKHDNVFDTDARLCFHSMTMETWLVDWSRSSLTNAKQIVLVEEKTVIVIKGKWTDSTPANTSTTVTEPDFLHVF